MRRRAVVLLAGAAAVLALASPARSAEDTVAGAVFGPGRFAAITAPVRLRYRFEVRGPGIEAAPPSPVLVDVRQVAADGAKQVWLELFEGAARRSFGPVDAREQNPVLITFLQLDVTEMGRLSGGASGYFQQQIRRSFGRPAEVQAVTVEVGGRSVPATRLTIRPFKDDPQIERFPAFRDKSYELTVSDDVPGGLWRLVARTPDAKTGELILEKALTFEASEPPG